MGCPLSCIAMRFATRLSSNSTQPSVKFLPAMVMGKGGWREGYDKGILRDIESLYWMCRHPSVKPPKPSTLIECALNSAHPVGWQPAPEPSLPLFPS